MSIVLFLILSPSFSGSVEGSPSPASTQDVKMELAAAAPIPEELTLDDALELLRQRSPLLESERRRLEAARGDLVQARTLPNPAFSLETEEYGALDGPSDTRNLFLGFEQPILTAGKRAKRSRVALALLEAAGGDLRAFERRLAYLTKLAHAAVVRAQSNLELTNDTLAEFDRILSLNRVRYERGEISGGELRRVEAERLSFLEEQVAAEIDLEVARADLLGLLGAPDYVGRFRAVASPPPLEDPPSVASLVDEALRARPELMAQVQRARAASYQLGYAKALAVPDIVPFVTYQTAEAASFAGGTRARFLNFGLRMDLPIFDRNQGGIARAEADRRRQAPSSGPSAIRSPSRFARHARRSSPSNGDCGSSKRPTYGPRARQETSPRRPTAWAPSRSSISSTRTAFIGRP